MMRGLISVGVCLLLVATAIEGHAESVPASPPEAAGVVFVAAPVGPTEAAFVDALTTRLRAEGLAVADAVSRAGEDAPAPRGRLTVRFDRAHQGTAVWLAWRGPEGGHGWAVRHAALDDPTAAVEQLVEDLQVEVAADGGRRGGTGDPLWVRRYDLWSPRYALAYNGAGWVVDLHQLEGEIRWPRFAVGMGYGYSSWAGSDGLDLDDDPYFAGVEGTTHSLRADIRWYGQATSNWYVYTGGRLTLGQARMVDSDGESDVAGAGWMNVIGVGGYIGDIYGLYLGLRGALPLYITGSETEYNLTVPQQIFAAIDLEMSLGWRF